jgi:predicted dehydrogenase
MSPGATRRQALKLACAATLFPDLSPRPPKLAFAGSDAARNREAARAAGFAIVDASYRDALADRSIHAICLATSLAERARMAIDACRAGKDIWVEAPVCASPAEGRALLDAARRGGRVVQAGTIWRSSRSVQEARRAVRRGDLGDIVFCRAFEGRGSACSLHLIDLLQFIPGDDAPASVAVQGSRGNLLATFRYPRFVASYERRGNGEPAIALHGATATLLVDPREAYARVAHWRDFLSCMRSRRRPVSDIATALPWRIEGATE